LGLITIALLFAASGKIDDVGYIWDGYRDPLYEGRFQLAIYVSISAIATAAVIGTIIRRIAEWLYRQIPLPLHKWDASIQRMFEKE
jgi:hypothetical protein